MNRRSLIVAAALIGFARQTRPIFRRSRFPKGVLFVLAVAVVVGALLGGVLRLAWPQAARAAGTCNSNPIHNTQTEDGSHRGVRSANMTVEDYSVPCESVDSVGVAHGVGFMEIGVQNIGSLAADCNGNHVSYPEFFLYYQTLTGADGGCCAPCAQTVVPWAKEGFATADQNEDGNWTFWHNGNVVNDPYGASIPFSTGLTITNAERHDSDDSSWGHFENNYFMTASGWSAYTSAVECGDGTNGATSNDPQWNNQIWSASNITVSTGSSVC